MARRTKAWLTPDTGDTSVVRGCLEIPAPLLPMVTGALSALTEVWNWQAFGTMTPEDAAEAATRMLFAFEDGTCSDMNCEDVLDCVLPYLQASLYDDATIRLEPTTEQPQVSYDGGTTWTDIPQSGNGTINAPQPTPTTGANDDAKICLAASRATLVIAEFYKQTFGAFTADVMNTLGTANSFLQDIKLVLFNAIYSPYDGIVEAAGFLEQDFETNYTAGELSSGNVEDLLCLLVDNASVDASGVVTFNYGSLRDNVIAVVGINPGTALWFLLGNMQGAGLNAAGSTRITDTALDCDPCLPDPCEGASYSFHSFNVTPGGASLPLSATWVQRPGSVISLCGAQGYQVTDSTAEYILDLGAEYCVRGGYVKTFRHDSYADYYKGWEIVADDASAAAAPTANWQNCGDTANTDFAAPITTRYITARRASGYTGIVAVLREINLFLDPGAV